MGKVSSKNHDDDDEGDKNYRQNIETWKNVIQDLVPIWGREGMGENCGTVRFGRLGNKGSKFWRL